MSTRQSRQLISLLIATATLAVAACNNQPSAHQSTQTGTATIRHLFTVWQHQQVRSGTYWPADSCKPQVVQRQQPASVVLGLPTDSSSYAFSYADLNLDGTLDGLVTFTPDQCDGGNGSMWVQVNVLLLSGHSGYSVTDTLDVEQFANVPTSKSGFYHLDSIAPNQLFGTYYEFNQNSGHCCPSVKRPVMFDFLGRKRLK